jgi:hypothetical protein
MRYTNETEDAMDEDARDQMARQAAPPVEQVPWPPKMPPRVKRAEVPQDPVLEALQEQVDGYWQALLAARERVNVAEAALTAGKQMLSAYRTKSAAQAAKKDQQ